MCPVLFINLFTPIEGPMTHQNIQGGICEQDGIYLSRSVGQECYFTLRNSKINFIN